MPNAAIPLSKIDAFALIDGIAAPAFVLSQDAMGRPVYAAYNSVALKAAKLDRKDVIGRTVTEVYGDELGPCAYAHHLQVFKSGEAEEYDITLPFDGAVRHIRTTLRPVRDNNGQMVYAVGTSIDRTAYLRAVSEAVQATEVDQFIYLAAHDLRTPLRHIATLSELLMDGFIDHGDGKTELIEMMEQVSALASDLLDDLLICAHSRTFKGNPERFELREVGAQIAQVLDPMGVHDLRIPPVTLFADKVGFQLLLRNLVDNAIKHGGKPHIRMRVTLNDSRPNEIELLFDDNGVGLEDPQKMFLNDGKFSFKSGYGLFAIRQLIQRLGGSINADTNPSGGCRITARFPGRVLSPPSMPLPILRATAKRPALALGGEARNAGMG